MPNAYVFQSALLCDDCANDAINDCHAPDGAPDGWHIGDSDVHPQGPYSDGGGEADSPQHCNTCGAFLENPLTSDGDSYVRNLAAPYDAPDSSWDQIAFAAESDGQHVLAVWIRHYFAAGQ